MGIGVSTKRKRKVSAPPNWDSSSADESEESDAEMAKNQFDARINLSDHSFDFLSPGGESDKL